MVALYAQASNMFITSQTYQKRSGDVVLGNSGRYCSVYKLQDKTEWGQNRCQKVFKRGALRLCRGAWHSKIWHKLHWFLVFHISIWLKLCFGG